MMPHPAGAPAKNRSLTDDQVVYALTSKEPLRRIAENLGCSKATISAIRANTVYKYVRPDLPRQQKLGDRQCGNCVHVSYRLVRRKSGAYVNELQCGLGIPEPLTLGAKAAQDCSYFTKESLIDD